MCQFTYSRPLVTTPHERQHVRRLTDLRNGFVHFVPIIMTYYVSGLPDVVGSALRITRFLGWECGNVHWGIHEAEEGRARTAIAGATELVGALRAAYKVD